MSLCPHHPYGLRSPLFVKGESLVSVAAPVYPICSCSGPGVIHNTTIPNMQIDWPASPAFTLLTTLNQTSVDYSSRPKNHEHSRIIVADTGIPFLHYGGTNGFQPEFLLKAYLQIMKAHYTLLQEADILHGDINPGVMLVSEKGTGMLIEWDRARTDPSKRLTVRAQNFHHSTDPVDETSSRDGTEHDASSQAAV